MTPSIAGDRKVRNSVRVLDFVLKELAACAVDTFLVAFHTCCVRRVTLNAGDLDALDFFPASALAASTAGSAGLCGFLVTGSDEGNDLVGE